ncbi:MAG: acetylxylan esterase [Armatimonadetes bacterium]|nr:acetylxylan esterase [Armatimonadota bacterium]
MKLFLNILVGLVVLIAKSEAAETVPPPGPGMLQAYFANRAERYLIPYREAMPSIATKAQWDRERKRLMKAYKTALGPFPRRTPLHARVVGRINRRECVIEKVIFESRPRFYVTGNLYLPLRRQAERHPAVLLLSGHYEEGKSDESSPHRQMGLALARQGVITFIIDPIGQGERSVYINAGGESTEYSTTQHTLMGYQCLLTGTNVMQYFLWDAIRAIDYLAQRPEVDAKRVAVTGVSGGGVQTYSLAPVEARAALLAPTCSVTSRLAYLQTGWAADAEQCLYGTFSEGLEQGALLALAAPRPYQVQATLYDIFPLQGTRESVAWAQRIYDLQGMSDRLNLVEDKAGHEYTPGLQNAFYKWLNRWFHYGQPASDGQAIEADLPQHLNCTATGRVKTSLPNARWVADFNLVRAQTIRPKRSLPDNLQSLKRYRELIIGAMRKVLAVRPKLSPMVETVSLGRNGKIETETVRIVTEPDITVTGVFSRPAGRGTHPAVLLISDSGNDIFAADRAGIDLEIARLRERLAGQGYAAMNIEVRGAGSSAPGSSPVTLMDSVVLSAEAIMTQNALMCGTNLFAGRVLDAMQCAAWLQDRPEVDRKSIALIGWGQGGLIALSAAALDNRIAACAAIGSLSTYLCLTETEKYVHPPSTFLWNVLAHYDLPEVAACIAPRPLLLAGPVDAMKRALPLHKAGQAYQTSLAAYRIAGASNALLLSDRSPDLERWLGGAVAHHQ